LDVLNQDPREFKKTKLFLFFLSWLWVIIFTNPYGAITSDSSLGAAVSFVDRGTLEVDPRTAVDVSLVDGKYYSGLPMGETLIAIPYYFLFRPILYSLPESLSQSEQYKFSISTPSYTPKEVYFLQILLVFFFLAPLNSLFIVIFFSAIYKLTNQFNLSLVISLIFLFATPNVYYSSMYCRQALSSLLIWIPFFYSLARSEEILSSRFWFLMGAFFGLSFSIDYLMIFGIAILMIYFIWARRPSRSNLFWCLASMLFFVFATLLYNKTYFKSFASTPYHFRAWLYPQHFMPFSFAGELYKFHDPEIAKLMGFRHPTLERLWGLSFSSYKGIFYFSPLLLLGLAGHFFSLGKNVLMKRTFQIPMICLLLFGIYFLYNSSLVGKYYWGGTPFFWGPRYLYVVTPFALLGLAFISGWAVSKKWMIFPILLGGYSAVINTAANMYGNHLRSTTQYNSLHPVEFVWKLLLENGPKIPLLSSDGLHGHEVVFILALIAVAVLLTQIFRRHRSFL